MAQTLYELLHDCTVRVFIQRGSQGTGFFVAPGLVLTCAHVIEPIQKNKTAVEIAWKGQTIPAQIQEFRDVANPDLALLQVNLTNHPCVLLYGGAEPFSQLYSYGYPDNEPQGASATFDCEGWAGDKQELLKFKEGQVRPGMSGSPLLSRETGGVCGIVQFTRGRDSSLGGKAMLTKVVLGEFPQLVSLQQQFHQQDQRWYDILTPQQYKDIGLVIPQNPAENTIEIFYSYVEEDEKFAQELQKHLILLKRRDIITDWYPSKIVPGEEPEEQIKRHLNTARIILLLVSPDFMYSEYHDSVCVKRAMERHQAGEAIIVPVILRPTTDWKEALFGKLQVIPRNGKPVSKWQDRDEAFTEVAKEIRAVVEKLKNPKPR